jgi:hypothetical protein
MPKLRPHNGQKNIMRTIILSLLCLALYSLPIQADCLWVNTSFVSIGPDSFLVKFHSFQDTTTITSTDTISKSKLLKTLFSRYDSATYCFLGKVETLKRNWTFGGEWWQNIDSILVTVDTALKGNGIPSYFWSLDVDPWLRCPSSVIGSDCGGLADDDYKSYAGDTGKRYIFFADTLNSVRSTSVSPHFCFGDKGNRLNDSGYVWSDYGRPYPVQVKIQFDSFLSKLATRSTVSDFKVAVRRNRQQKADFYILYDIKGRRIGEFSADQMPRIRLGRGIYIQRTIINNKADKTRKYFIVPE